MNENNEALAGSDTEFKDTEVKAALVVAATYNNENIMSNEATAFFSSLPSETDEQKMLIFNALTDTDKLVNDMINKRITIKDIIATVVDIVDDETGVVEACPRVILIDVDGVAYNAISKGIHTAIKNLVSAFGAPDKWTSPIIIEIVQKKVNRGTMNTFKVVGFGKSK